MALRSEHIEYYGKLEIESDRFAPLVKLRTVLLPFSSLCYKGPSLSSCSDIQSSLHTCGENGYAKFPQRGGYHLPI